MGMKKTLNEGDKMVNTCVVFVNPFDFDRDILSDEIHSGPLYLASYLKARFGEDINIQFLDLKIEVEKNHKVPLPFPGKWNQFLAAIESLVMKKVKTTGSRVFFGISCLSSKQYVGTLFTGIVLRDLFPDSIIVVGGYHSSSYIADFRPYGHIFNYIVFGEGEIAFADIIIKEQAANSHRELVNPRVITGEPVQDLNDLPRLNLQLFSEYLGEYHSLSINLSRGCPFPCDFCAERDLMGKQWRAYTPQRAVEEITNQVKVGQDFGIRKYGFYDPNFGHDRMWRVKVLELMIQKNFGVEFWSETRFDTISQSDLELYSRAKLSMMFGLESGSPIMLKIMKKTGNPHHYLDHFRKIMLWSKELKYPSVINILFNHPGETFATMQESQQFLLEILHLNPNAWDNSMIYRHYPGSEIFNNSEVYTQKHGTRFFGGKWWHLLTNQRKAAMLNQASYHLPMRIASETFFQYEIMRLETILDNVKESNTFDLPKIFQLKALLTSAKAELKGMQEEKVFFASNPPQVPAALWEELPAVLQESSLSLGQLITVPK
jgi:radical SAM superfamily enzyme YgiQ (UPF0313 family)